MRCNLLWTLAFLFIIGFTACEFDSDKEFYKEIEKPEEIMVGIDLAGVRPGEPIYIYEDTRLFYTLNISGKKLLKLEATLNGQYLHMMSYPYIVVPKASLSANGENILKLKIQLKTDSGSIADILNAEVYEGEFTFRLLPVDNEFDLAIRNAQTEEKYLRVEWDKPSFEQLEIAGYEIAYTDTRGKKQTKLLDASATSFVDKDYVYGYRSYSITMKFVEEKISKKTYIHNISYTPITSDDITMEFKDLESTKISWNPNKYRCNYYILYNRNDKVVASALFDEPEVILPAPAFPEESGFYTVVIVPDDMGISEISYNSGGVEKFYQYKAPKSPLDMAVQTYDIPNNLLYGRTGNAVKIGNASDLKTLRSYDSPYFDNLTSVSVSPKSNKLLVFIGYNGSVTDNIIYLYDDKNNLGSTPKIVRIPPKDSRYGTVLLINDNRIFIGLSHDSENNRSFHSLIDANTGDIIDILETQMFHFTNVSYDCERLAFYDRVQQQLHIYSIHDSGFEQTHTINIADQIKEDLIYSTFNPKDADQIVIHSFSGKKFFVVDIPFQKIKQIEGEFETIDPFTGRIYSYDKDYNTNSLMNIYQRGNYDAPVFQFKAQKYGSYIAYNDFVFSYQSYVQISKYIK